MLNASGISEIRRPLEDRFWQPPQIYLQPSTMFSLFSFLCRAPGQTLQKLPRAGPIQYTDNTPNVARFGIGQARADKADLVFRGARPSREIARHSAQAEFVRGRCLPHSDTAVAARLEVHVTNEVLKNLSGRGVTSKETRPWILRFFTISAAIAKSRYPGFAEDPI